MQRRRKASNINKPSEKQTDNDVILKERLFCFTLLKTFQKKFLTEKKAGSNIDEHASEEGCGRSLKTGQELDKHETSMKV